MTRYDTVKRCAAVVLFVALAVMRAAQYPAYANKVLWLTETIVFVVLAAVFLVRTAPRVRAAGPSEVVLPYLASAVPFAMTLVPQAAQAHVNAAWGLMIVGEVLTVAGISTLGRSFGISVEVRTPVQAGLYRWIRHPIYLGEAITTAGLACIHWSPAAALVLAVFVAAQATRARMEEQKLCAASAEYRQYRQQTGMFLPRLLRSPGQGPGTKPQQAQD